LVNPSPSEPQKGHVNPRYAYIVLLVCFLIMVLVYGAQYCFGVFFKPMIAEFGWSRAATSGPFALYSIIGGFLAILSGRLSDHLGSRLILTIGGLIFGAGYLLTSRIDSLWQLYFCFGFICAAGFSTIYSPLVATITRWFPQKRGLMAGIGISGIGFGIGIVPVFASALIINTNWRTSMLVVGIICLVLTVLLAQLIKEAPPLSDANQADPGQQPRNSVRFKELTFGQAVKTAQFWLFFAAWVGYGFFFQVALVHIVPYASDTGLSVTTAATVLTVIGLVGTGARIALGFSGDRFGHKTIVTISFGVLALAYFGLAGSGSIWMLYVFGILYGCFSGFGVLLGPILTEFFGFKTLGVIVGAMMLAFALGGAVGPPLAGAIFDTTKSYQAAFMVSGLIGLTSAILMLLIKPTTGPKQLEK
jgi:MFS transporter, OFA family, oxalate/formate antiporter